MTKPTEIPQDLKDSELEKVRGAGTKGLLGDDIGQPFKGGIKPTVRSLESETEDE